MFCNFIGIYNGILIIRFELNRTKKGTKLFFNEKTEFTFDKNYSKKNEITFG